MKLWLKLFLLHTLLLAMLAVFTLLAVRQVVIGALRSEHIRQGTTTAHSLADRVADLIVLEDAFQTEKVLEALVHSEDGLEYAFVLGLNGEVFAHTFGANCPDDLITWNSVTNELHAVQLLATEVGLIRDIGVKVFDNLDAELHLGLRETRLRDTQTLIIKRVLAGCGMAIFGAWLLSVFFSRYLTRPLYRLVTYTERLAQGEFGIRMPVSGPTASRDEFGHLSTTFNTLSQKLALYHQRTRESFRHMLRAEKLSALGRLAAGLAHEIRNPLTSLKILFQSFPKGPPPTQQDSEVILAEIERIETLLTRFLAFTRSQESKPAEVNLQTLLEHVLRMTRLQLEHSHIQVTTHFHPTPPVWADSAMLIQVLLNLIMNAIEAMPSGGDLMLTLKERDGRVEVRIRDTGGGIPEAVQEKIFDPFFTTKTDGTGLGLSIACTLVTHSNGTIDFFCHEDGATFIVQLPAMSPAATDERGGSRLCTDATPVKL